MNTTRALIVVDNAIRAKFFARFTDAFARRGAACVFMTYRLSAHRYLRRMGLESMLLVRQFSRKRRNTLPENVKRDAVRSLEVMRGDTNRKNVNRSLEPLVAEINRCIAAVDPTHVFLWNGSQLVEKLVAQSCPADVEKRYFEIANVPQRIFVDSEGVNAASSIYHSPQKLLSCEIPSDREFDAWRAAYLQSKLEQGVPQAKFAQSLQWERPLDAVASRLGYGYYPIRASRMATRLFGKLSTDSRRERLIDANRIPGDFDQPYRFLPLQVSHDTQLLLNSEVGNLEAITYASKHCEADRVSLVAKVHPAENDPKSISEISARLRELASRSPVFLSDGDTSELIHGAERVYTINSTVGLESLILGTPVEVLGRAFFQSFVDRRDLLKSYLLRYLVAFDYFANDQVSEKILERVLVSWPNAA